MPYMGFKKLTTALKRKGAKNPKALAAWIGREKMGKTKFHRRAALGRENK